MTSELGILDPGGKTGILLLHDLTGTVLDMRPMAQGFARAGYTVCTPRLSAHEGGAGWSSATAIRQAGQATIRLTAQCAEVIVVGAGYGAMLALEVARQNAAVVPAIVLLEPRTSVMPLCGCIAAAVAGLVPQTWLARLVASTQRAPLIPARLSALSIAGDAAVVGGAATGSATQPVPGLTAAALTDLARLLDSAQAGLASVTQPSLLFHGRTRRRGGGGSIVLQRRLAGRVESVMIDDAGLTGAHGHLVDSIVDRSARFVATVLDENETMRGNEQRRQRLAGRSTAA